MHDPTVEVPNVKVICNESGHTIWAAQVLQLLLDLEAKVIRYKLQRGRFHHTHYKPFRVGSGTREFCCLAGQDGTLRLHGCTSCRRSTGCQRKEVKVQNAVQEILVQTPKRCLRRAAVCISPASGSSVSSLVRTCGLRKVELRKNVLIVFGQQECLRRRIIRRHLMWYSVAL